MLQTKAQREYDFAKDLILNEWVYHHLKIFDRNLSFQYFNHIYILDKPPVKFFARIYRHGNNTKSNVIIVVS